MPFGSKFRKHHLKQLQHVLGHHFDSRKRTRFVKQTEGYFESNVITVGLVLGEIARRPYKIDCSCCTPDNHSTILTHSGRPLYYCGSGGRREAYCGAYPTFRDTSAHASLLQ